MNIRCLFGFALAVMVTGSVFGADEYPQVSQTFSIRSGWNMLYLNVVPEETANEIFEAWPTDSVAIYRTENVLPLGTLTSASSAPLTRYFTWHRGSSVASNINYLPGDCVLVFKADEALTNQTITGMPMGRRVQWEGGAEATNYFGVQTVGNASVAILDYLNGLEGNPALVISSATGKDDENGGPALSIRSTTAKVKTGDVLVIQSAEAGMWSGVFSVLPREGVLFGEHKTSGTYTVQNTSKVDQTITLSYTGAREGATPSFMIKVLQWDEEVGEVWRDFTEPISKVLAPGEFWEVSLGLDRTQFASDPCGEMRSGVLTATSASPSLHLVQVPVCANAYTSQSETTAGRWPNGLWLLSAQMDTVTRIVSSDGTVEHDLPTASTMPVRLLMYVDGDRKMKLLQRVTVAMLGDEGLKQAQVLYGPEAQLSGTESSSMRLSSPLMPVDEPIAEVTGTFLASATSRFVVGANSPSNPWRHAYHPEHDGLDWDFKEPAPDGDTFENYLGPVKPELWSVDNALEIIWNPANEAWTPEEEYTGVLKWTVTGLRHEAPIVIRGPFTFRRILVDPTYQEK